MLCGPYIAAKNAVMLLIHLNGTFISGELNQDEADEITDQANYNSRKASDRELGGMHSKTRKALQKFYRPFNEDLATILKDKRFLWQDYDSSKAQGNSTLTGTTSDT